MNRKRTFSNVGMILLTTFVLLSFCGTALINVEEGSREVNDDLRSAQDGEINPLDITEEISKQIVVPAGKEYYVIYDGLNHTLIEIPLATPTMSFPQSVLDAIDRSPNWIKGNLTRKFEQMADEPIDATDYSAPTFGDLDADGDLDLVVGTEADGLKHFECIERGLHYYEGYDVYVGCVLTSNASTFGPMPLTRADPALTDLDGDNDLDIIVGVSTGVWRILNLGSPQSPSWGSLQTTSIAFSYSSVDVGDVDADGDPDIVVGNEAGELYLSENTAMNPQYISDGDPSTVTSSTFSAPTYLGLDAGDYASPALADIDYDGDLDLFSGNGAGGLRYYENLWDPTNPYWTTHNASLFGSLDVGSYSAPTFADVDLDTLPDIVIGDYVGRVHYLPNVGTASRPQFLVWDSVPTTFDWFNRNYYYVEDSETLLKERTIPAKMIDYANLINTVPDNMVDELSFSIANTATSSLMHSSAYPDAYRNNTEALYYNDNFIDYADILDFGNVSSGDYYSTLRYWVNESGTRVEYTVPTNIYYWYVAHPRVSYELPTFINPNVVTNLHGGAAAPPAGRFWRWYLFNENDTAWPPDPGAVKYPKDEGPPLMREKLVGVTTLWNVTNHTSPAGYGNDGHNNTRPWNYSDHAIERVSHWVSLTLALNAQEHNDANRPRQPVRIAHEHNGNCGELSDLTSAAFRAALIPARGVMSATEDHCWNEFWHNGWHHHDNYWSNSASIIGNNDFKHYTPGWNRDWTAIYGWQGDSRVTHHIDTYHHEEDFNGDGFQDRGNVSVKVVDANGNPVDGAKVSIAGWRFLSPSWLSIGDYSAYTGPDGIAFFTTSEARQGDSMDDGIQIDVGTKFGGGPLNLGYDNRFKICIDPPNLPLYSYQYQVSGTVPRPWFDSNPASPPETGEYWLDIDFDVLFGIQHPLVDATGHADDQVDGDRVAHPEYFSDNITLDAFIADEQNFWKYVRGETFDALNLSLNATTGSIFLGLPLSGENMYFVLSNRDSLETKKMVNLTFRLVHDTLPVEPRLVRGSFTGITQEDVTITWQRSADDGLGSDDVSQYTIHRSTDYHGPYSLVDTIPANDSPFYNWTDPGMGVGDVTDYFYYVVCHDNLSQMRSPETIGKVVRYAYAGPNLLSIPVSLYDSSVAVAFETIEFDHVRTYDASDTADPWKAFHTSKYTNDLLSIDPLKGLWVNALSAGDLTVIGLIQPSYSIDLESGWNLVGYPSFDATYTVGDLKTELGAMRVEGYDPSAPPHYLNVLPDSYVLSAGESYWIRLPSPMTWNIVT